MSGRRGRPPGARPPSEKDLKTLKIGQFFHQQPFAPIFQQRMGGGASQGAGSQHDHVDLTGATGESCSEAVTSSSAQNDTPTAAEARDCLQQFLATYSDSEESDGAPSSAHPPSTAGPSPHAGLTTTLRVSLELIVWKRFVKCGPFECARGGIPPRMSTCS